MTSSVHVYELSMLVSRRRAAQCRTISRRVRCRKCTTVSPAARHRRSIPGGTASAQYPRRHGIGTVSPAARYAGGQTGCETRRPTHAPRSGVCGAAARASVERSGFHRISLCEVLRERRAEQMRADERGVAQGRHVVDAQVAPDASHRAMPQGRNATLLRRMRSATCRALHVLRAVRSSGLYATCHDACRRHVACRVPRGHVVHPLPLRSGALECARTAAATRCARSARRAPARSRRRSLRHMPRLRARVFRRRA